MLFSEDWEVIVWGGRTVVNLDGLELGSSGVCALLGGLACSHIVLVYQAGLFGHSK